MIELNNICFQYANTEESSLENVSLQIPDGQCILFCGESGCGKTTIGQNSRKCFSESKKSVLLIGQNGAGKSTFSRCLCGLEKKFKGKVMIGEKILHRKQLLKQCYMVMQDVNHQLFCESVEEEVQLGMANENCRNVSDVLENLDLERLTEHHPMSLSGGQKQRVAIASAILADKSILVFDEPTSGLDYCHMEQTAKLITSLKGKKTIFIVIHDPELIIRCCTHILHLEEGTVYDLYELNQEGTDKIEHFFLPACD